MGTEQLGQISTSLQSSQKICVENPLLFCRIITPSFLVRRSCILSSRILENTFSIFLFLRSMATLTRRILGSFALSILSGSSSNLYLPVSALCMLSKEGVAEPSTTGQLLNLAKTTAESRALYLGTISACL